MASLSGVLKMVANLTYSSSSDLSDVTDVLSFTKTNTIASGTGNDQADLIFHDQRTLTTGASEDLDLAGTLTDSFGNTLTFVDVKAIIVKAANGNSTNLTIGGATNPLINWVAASGDGVIVQPDGMFMITAPNTGFAVTAGTGDILTVANAAGASATYDIIIIGTSA